MGRYDALTNLELTKEPPRSAAPAKEPITRSPDKLGTPRQDRPSSRSGTTGAVPQDTATPSETVGATKRSLLRRSFDFYEDQVAYLTRVSLENRLAGEEGSMNAMVREAVDDYIAKKKAGR